MIGGTVLASGPGGTEVRVEAGDVVVMPVGVSHAMIDNSEDGMAIGGYPEGRYRDKIQEESVSEADFRAAAKFIMFLPTDPVTSGPLTQWLETPSSVDAGGNDFHDGLEVMS